MNKKDFAVGIIANNIGTEGTLLEFQAGYGQTMADVPFYLTLTPPAQITTLGNSEKVLVTEKVDDEKFIIVRAQGDTIARDIKAGWIAGNGIYVEDLPSTPADVQLPNVDNTSDLDKPVSTATQTALDGKVSVVSGKGLSTNDYTDVDKAKLDTIEENATANSSDEQLRDRAQHTGVQPIQSVDGLEQALGDKQPAGNYATAAQGALADTSLQPGSVAPVALSGSYADLTEKPNIPSVAGFATEAYVNEVGNLKLNLTDVVNNLTSTATDKPLSAEQGRQLKVFIDTINTAISSDDTSLDRLQEIVDFIKLNRDELDNLTISGVAGLQAALDGKQPLGNYATATQGAKADTAVQPDTLTAHTSDTSNPHSVTKAQVGLGNVDNTSDINKPLSTATKSYIDTGFATKTDVDGKMDKTSASVYATNYEPQKIISQFKLSEWSKQSSGGTITQNTTDFISGGESLDFITPATANGAVFADKSIAPTDMTNAVFRVAVKCSDYTKFNGIWCDLGDSPMTNLFRLNVVQDPRSLKDGEWNYITFSSADLRSTTGTPNWANISKIRLRVNAATAADANVSFDNISYSISEHKPRVVITFDDGYKTDISVAKPIMDEYGLVGTSYIIKDRIDTDASRMTLADLKHLQRCNWSIASHGSPDLTTLSEDELESEFEAITGYLKANWFSGYNHYAYPMGRYNSTVLRVASKYFATARTIHTQPETSVPAERLKLRVFYAISSTTNTQLQNALTLANRNGITLIIVFHRIVPTPSAPEDVSVTSFTTFMQTISSSGIGSTNIEMAMRF